MQSLKVFIQSEPSLFPIRNVVGHKKTLTDKAVVTFELYTRRIGGTRHSP